MGLNNINNLPPSVDIEDADYFIIAGIQRTGEQVNDYMGGDTSVINDTDRILKANKNTGRGVYVTMLQLKAWRNGQASPVTSVDIFPIIRSGAFKKVTATLVKIYLGGTAPTLSTPTGFNATALSTTQIDLVWNAVTNNQAYVLQRAVNSGFTAQLTTVYTGANTSFSDTGLLPSTIYFYRVKATAEGYLQSAYATDNATTEDINTLPATGLRAVLDFSAPSVTLSGSDLVQVNDISGNGNHFTAPESGYRGVYNGSGGPNGRPYAAFTGDDYIQGHPIDGESHWTMYIAFRQSSFVALDTLAVFHQLYDSIRKRSDIQPVYFSLANNAQYANYMNANRLNRWQIMSTMFSPVANSMRINNENKLTNTSTGLVVNPAQYVTIMGPTSGGTHDVAYVVIYTGTPSDADDSQIRAFLKTKIQPPENISAFFFGDSITKGEGVGPMQSFAFLTSQGAGGLDAQIYNYGVAGSIVAPWMGQLGNTNFADTYVNAIADTYEGNYVVVAYGTNDASGGNTADATWKSQYKDLVQNIINYGYDPQKIVMGTPPYQSLRPTMPSFVEKIGEIATELGTKFYDAYADTLANGGDSLLYDGIHMNAAGHAIFAAGVLDVINS